MEKILDVIFWFINNQEQSKKLRMYVLCFGMVILIGVTAYLIYGIPDVVNKSVTGG